MAIENMPLDQLERMAKNGVLVAKKELERRNQEKKPPPTKRCTRCENGEPKDQWAMWTGRRFYGGGIVLCAECLAIVKVSTERRG